MSAPPTYIEGTVTLSDGRTQSFAIDPDTGWHQWGGTTEQLAETGELMDALAPAAYEGGLRSADEDA